MSKKIVFIAANIESFDFLSVRADRRTRFLVLKQPGADRLEIVCGVNRTSFGWSAIWTHIVDEVSLGAGSKQAIQPQWNTVSGIIGIKRFVVRHGADQMLLSSQTILLLSGSSGQGRCTARQS
ncbi:hypothetical protein [Paraburkholderia sp. SIMBA_030]|uniref:hypothetical protein n=2 Tax=Bacteria TaxID=2 RepID=UPI00397D5066